MLDKARRLTRKRDFMKLATQGRPIYGQFSALRVRALPGVSSQVAFITSTKVMKRAVDRNRAKRRMRAILRELWSSVPTGLHLLFILKPECKSVDYKTLQDEVLHMLSKIPAALQKPAKISSRGVKYKNKYARPIQKPV